MVMNTMKLKKTAGIVFAIAFSLTIPILMGSCVRSDPESPVGIGPGVDTSQEVQSKISKVNVFIENSGSMDGFIKGLTHFQDDIGVLLTDMLYHYGEENIKIYFIHNDLHEVLKTREVSNNVDLTNVADWLNIEWVKEQRGSNTKLNNIFSTILDATSDSTVSILISDCIYSIGKNGKTINMLNSEKTTTRGAFLKRSKRGDINLATSIYRMTSEFHGNYYPYTGDSDYYPIKGLLPYYICVFADNDVMNEFCSKIKISEEEYKGYCTKYAIAHTGSEELYWTILPNTGKKGRFQTTRSVRGESCSNKVQGIEKVQGDRDGVFSFSVAVDMSGVNVDEEYLLDTSNYVLDNSRYVITSIAPFNKDEINPTDWLKVSNSPKKPTHVITIETTGTAVCDLEVSLERKMPQWVDQYNIMDDTNPDLIKKGGTFGLKYWIEGISGAYETIYPEDNTYFNLKIKIKK